MRKLFAAALAAAMTVQFAAPALARDFFNPATMLGWRKQTGPAAVAYFRAPIGPSRFKAPVRTGLSITGPRSYTAGSAPFYSQGPRLLDFAFTRRDPGTPWIAQLNVGNGIAWTSDRKYLEPGQVNLLESGGSWVAVGAVAVGVVAGTFAFIEKDKTP